MSQTLVDGEFQNPLFKGLPVSDATPKRVKVFGLWMPLEVPSVASGIGCPLVQFISQLFGIQHDPTLLRELKKQGQQKIRKFPSF